MHAFVVKGSNKRVLTQLAANMNEYLDIKKNTDAEAAYQEAAAAAAGYF